MKARFLVLVAALLTITAACTSSSTSNVVQGGNFEKSTASGCGVERWAVKTGTDSAAAQVNMKPQATMIADLVKLAVPAGFSQDAPRLPGAEMQTYTVSATLVEFKMENDGDYHLVLKDAQGNTMIAEIPKPSCVHGTSPFLTAITSARAAFEAQFPFAANGGFQKAGIQVTVLGVGFFDTIHGQTGVAPNGIELHPVLSITFTGPTPSPSPEPSGSASGSPTPSAAPTPTVVAGCFPLSRHHHCYEPGDFCRSTDAGKHGVAGNGAAIVCKTENGHLVWRVA